VNGVLRAPFHHRAAAGWRVEPQWDHKDPQAEWWHMTYVLYSPQQPDARVGVAEWDDLSGVLVRDNFCRRTASYEMGTVAGLSMRIGTPGERRAKIPAPGPSSVTRRKSTCSG
jgi:hypothetical protein